MIYLPQPHFQRIEYCHTCSPLSLATSLGYGEKPASKTNLLITLYFAHRFGHQYFQSFAQPAAQHGDILP